MKRLLKGILIYLRYALQSIGTVFSGLAVLVYVNLIALKNKNSVIYLNSRHLGDLASRMSFIPAEKGQIVIVEGPEKKELADLFSEKEVKFVFYGKLIKRCMRSQMCRPIFPGYKYADVVANSKVLNLNDFMTGGGYSH